MSIHRKVSAHEPDPPLAKSGEAEHARRQINNSPFPPGGKVVAGEVAASGTTDLPHSLGRAPQHYIIFDLSAPVLVAVTTMAQQTITVTNSTASTARLKVYIW